MSLSRRQLQLIEIALDRLDTIPAGARREPVEYILDQLVNGATAEYHAGARPEREDHDVLIDTLRLHMPGLPKLSDID
jgi:hypothetical protein